MWLIRFIQNLFQKESKSINKPQKTIQDLDILDSVWIREEGVLFEGWVFDITRRCIIVVYGKDLRDFRFRLEKPLDRTEIEQNNKILYCNEPTNESYIRISRE